MKIPAFFKTTAMKLTVIYMAVFIVFSLFAVGYIFYTANTRLRVQLDSVIASEIAGLRGHYERLGIRGLLDHVQSRSRQPGAPALLVTNFQGRGLVGNIPTLPPDFLGLDKARLHPLPYNRTDPEGQVESTLAMVRIFELPGGFNLVIGRDIGEREEIKTIISDFVLVAIGALALLGFLSWYLVGRRALRRIDNMSATSQKIIAGNLSERLAVEGSGDEFDRLADNVNGLLDRIEALMFGLKDVSDNIAHDLKTPLTRMRNRVEAALSGKSSKAELQAALEGTIVESDNLIRTFDALLHIARVEAGSSIGIDENVDLQALIKDVTELYEPVAEEAGVTLNCQSEQAEITCRVNRDLISQAVANLLDNAIKYAAFDEEEAYVGIEVRQTDKQTRIIVHDNGPGIPVSDYENVTKRFARLERSRTKPGSGLGLSLVAAVSKLHGGSLIFDDNKPGLKATISLPRRPQMAKGRV